MIEQTKLVHILSSEGYDGQGLELRPRKTWAAYPETTQAKLKKHAVHPTELLDSCHDGQSPFNQGAFLIGNHADEMTVGFTCLTYMFVCTEPTFGFVFFLVAMDSSDGSVDSRVWIP